MPDPRVRDAIRAQYQQQVAGLTAEYLAGTLSLVQWYEGMKAQLRDSDALVHRAGAAKALAYTDYLKVGGLIQRQYRGLSLLHQGLQAGTVSGDSLKVRVGWLVESCIQAYRPIQYRKDFSDTADSFAGTLDDAFSAAQSGDIDRRNFAGTMRSALRSEGLVAYRDGMNEVGYDPESLSAEEVQTFKDWLDRQSQLVTNLGDELFHQGGITQGEIANRVRMWVHTSLEEIHALGIMAGDGNQSMVWVYNEEAQHCPECLVLDGQVHPIKAWISNGILPGNWSTSCKAGCKCHLEKTDQPESGTYLD